MRHRTELIFHVVIVSRIGIPDGAHGSAGKVAMLRHKIKR